MKIKGTFKVKMDPLDSSFEAASGAAFNRMKLEKSYDGPLTAQSKGEMLSMVTTVKGSAGYVAIEQVEGTLQGKVGSFALQHFGIMHGGNNKLILEVIPGSGTDALKGLSGTMEIIIEAGNHFYEFDYQLS